MAVRPVKIAILALSAGALKLGAQLAKAIPADFYPCKGELRQRFTALWHSHDALICIMASGIVVRHLAPLVQDKLRDPAVLVVDERGRFVISLLSGHMGGANSLAKEVAALTDFYVDSVDVVVARLVNIQKEAAPLVTEQEKAAVPEAEKESPAAQE